MKTAGRACLVYWSGSCMQHNVYVLWGARVKGEAGFNPIRALISSGLLTEDRSLRNGNSSAFNNTVKMRWNVAQRPPPPPDLTRNQGRPSTGGKNSRYLDIPVWIRCRSDCSFICCLSRGLWDLLHIRPSISNLSSSEDPSTSTKWVPIILKSN